MRKIYLLLFMTGVICSAQAQNVGIGTTAPSPNALLHLENGAADLGLLLPNVETAGFTPLATDEGLMVYDSVLNQIFSWDGSAWQPAGGTISLQSAYDGGQLVNMGSGNIDFQSSAANPVLYLDEANERIGIGTAAPGERLDIFGGNINIDASFAYLQNGNHILSQNPGNASFFAGQNSGQSITTGTSNTLVGLNAGGSLQTGSENTALGEFAFGTNITGSQNTAIGTGSQIQTNGSFNTTLGAFTINLAGNTGQRNTAVGASAMRLSPAGDENTAIGMLSIQDINGNLNTGLGYRSGLALLSGDNNTFIGANADAGITPLTNATAIGADAIVSQNNSLVLGNNANVGIGTSTPANKLEVIGDAAKFDSVIIANNAQAGYVLTAADASGAASWQPGGGGSAWDLTGNAGTVDGTNFIGTTDNVPLSFRFNNLPSGKLDSVSTSFGLDALSSLTTGIDNTAFGVSALQSNTIGIRSTALGRDALQFNTTGSSNTAVGYQSLNFNTVGVENTATGYQALQFNVDGSRNTGNGTTTLYQNTSGSDNSAFGYQALFSNTIGINNTADGTWALQNNTTGNSNTSIGFQALNINTTGSDNTAIGANADVASPVLTNATAIGANTIVSASNALVLGNNANVGIGTSTPTSKLEVVGDALINSLTVGRGSGNDISNTAFGNQALAANLAAGLANTAIGQSALSSNTTGTSSTALGFYALRLNTTGYSNVAVGHGALDNNSIGFENTAVGQGALQANTTGSRNTSLGRGTLSNNTTGSYNIGIGWEALVGHLSGNYNTAIGNDVLRNNSGGSNNTGVGSFAVQGTTGDNNTGFGNSALRNNTTGNDNTAIGFSADVSTGALTNATAIGANTIVSTSNALVLGNNANVGIGTSAPANKLEVIGDAAKFDSVIIANNAQAGYVLTAADATGAASWQPAASGVSGTGATNKLAYWSAANTLTFNTGLHYESASQRLGIGTAAPAEFLHVNSGNPITVASRFTNASTGSTGSDGFGFGITGTGNAFINNDEATPINISTASTTRMTIGATGNIGIGNLTPNAPLHFTTSLANRKIVLFEGANNDHQYFGFGVNGAALRYQINGNFASHIFYASVNTTTSNELMRIVGDGRVGIGTSTPTAGYLLDVTGADAIINGITVGRGGGTNTNTALGANALSNNTGSGNVGIGLNALQNNLGGVVNIAIGSNSLGANTTGSFNIAIGENSQNGSASSSDNVSLGVSALENNQGNLNTAIGNNTLRNNTTGNSNHAIGYNALNGNTTGGGNIAMGNEALFNTNADANVGLGNRALIGNTSGEWNVSVGARSTENNTIGINNTSVGAFAMDQNVSGSNNTAIGYGATTIGGNLNNATAIGANANVSASNRMVLGTPGTDIQFDGELRPANDPGSAGDVLVSGGPGVTPTWGSAPASVGTGTINRLTYWNTSSSIASGSNLGWNNALEYLGVGIGLPERPLHLHRASADDVFAKFTNTVSFIGAGNGFEIGLSSSNEVLLRHYENTSMRFYTNNAERMTIDGSGNLGFGTPPVAGNRITARIGSSGGTAGYFENNIGSGIDGSALRVLNSGTRSIGHNGALIQNLVTKVGGSNSTKRGLKIESTGAWGVATVNQPNIGLDVTVSGADNNYAAVFLGGNVGIGVANPGDALQVSGTIRATNLIAQSLAGFGVGVNAARRIWTDAGSTDIALYASQIDFSAGKYAVFGEGRNGGTTAWLNVSDRRLKKNIIPIENALENVLKLRGVNFDWRNEEFPDKGLAQGHDIGLIAQEVKAIYPEFVNLAPDGFYGVSYAGLVPVLIEAIKEQQVMIENQKSEIESLQVGISQEKIKDLKTQDQINSLQSQIDYLNNLITAQAKK